MSITILIIVLYILPAICWWRYCHVALSKDGIWHAQSVDLSEVLIVFCPGLNLAYSFVGWIWFYPKEGASANYAKFFRVK